MSFSFLAATYVGVSRKYRYDIGTYSTAMVLKEMLLERFRKGYWEDIALAFLLDFKIVFVYEYKKE